MLWIKTLHLAALVTWCAALLCVIAGLGRARTPRGHHTDAPALPAGTLRDLFIAGATPAALLTIAAGTALFPWVPSTEGWLAGKLVVVTGLMGCHLLSGWAVLKQSEEPDLPLLWPRTLLGLACCTMLLTLWLVLARPG